MRYRNIYSLILHAACSGLLLAIRIPGVVIPFMTVIILLGNSFLPQGDNPENREKLVKQALLYVFLCFTVTLLLWPAAWDNPLQTFIQSMLVMAQFPQGGMVHYMGDYFPPSQLPWHYLPVWILITTPIGPAILAMVGVAGTIFTLVHSWIKRKKPPLKPFDFFCIGLAGILFFLLVVNRPTLYNGWRQCFFVFPLVVFASLFGVRYLCQRNLWMASKTRKIAGLLIIIALTTNLVWTSVTMIRLHPYQYVYFNRTSQVLFPNLPECFDGDYWLVSVSDLLSSLVEKQPDGQVLRVTINTNQGETIAWIMPKRLRERVSVQNGADLAKVLLPMTPELKKMLDTGLLKNMNYYPPNEWLVAKAPVTEAQRDALLKVYATYPYHQAVNVLYESAKGIGQPSHIRIRYEKDLVPTDKTIAVIKSGSRIISLANKITDDAPLPNQK